MELIREQVYNKKTNFKKSVYYLIDLKLHYILYNTVVLRMLQQFRFNK